MIPKDYTELVGTKQLFSGGLFSYKKDLPEKEYDVLDVRWGSAHVVNVKEMRETGKSSYKHPTVEFLLKSDDMKKSQWSRGFAVIEINIDDE